MSTRGKGKAPNKLCTALQHFGKYSSNCLTARGRIADGA